MVWNSFWLQVLTSGCGLSERQIKAIAKEGYLTITIFLLNLYLDIDNFVKKLQELSPKRGGVHLSHMLILCLKAFLTG